MLLEALLLICVRQRGLAFLLRKFQYLGRLRDDKRMLT
jgi:hypothetical protein